MHMSGLLISLWDPANQLFIPDKYVMPTRKRLHVSYIQKQTEVIDTTELTGIIDTTACSKQHVRVMQQ